MRGLTTPVDWSGLSVTVLIHRLGKASSVGEGADNR